MIAFLHYVSLSWRACAYAVLAQAFVWKMCKIVELTISLIICGASHHPRQPYPPRRLPWQHRDDDRQVMARPLDIIFVV